MQYDELTVGCLVKFTDTKHRLYQRLKDYIGEIQSLDTFDQSCQSCPDILWYTDDTFEEQIANDTFFIRRLTLYEPTLTNTTPRTKLEKKCRKLWNNSKYIQNNPHLAY